MMSRTLYEITKDMQALDDLLTQAGGDVTDEGVLDAIEKWMNELDVGLVSKVDGYAGYISDLLATAKARKEEANRLRDLAIAGEKTAKRMKETLLMALVERDIRKLDTPRFVVTCAKNGGKAPLDIQIPGEDLPPRFQRVFIEPDKDAIREALDAGEEVDGCTIMQRGMSLRIR